MLSLCVCLRGVLKNICSFDHWMYGQHVAFQILSMHIHGGDTAVVVGRVVVYACVRVAAGAVNGKLIAFAFYADASALKADGAEHVEEMADAARLICSAYGVKLDKSCPHKPRRRGTIPRQAQRPHTTAIAMQSKGRRKGVFRRSGGQGHVIVQVRHVVIEGRIVGQHAHGIVVDAQTLLDAFGR